MQIAKTILRRLFRVYAHIYHSHFDQICALGIEGMCQDWTDITLPLYLQLANAVRVGLRSRSLGQAEMIAHLNTNYRHFLLFVDEVSLYTPVALDRRPMRVQ